MGLFQEAKAEPDSSVAMSSGAPLRAPLAAPESGPPAADDADMSPGCGSTLGARTRTTLSATLNATLRLRVEQPELEQAGLSVEGRPHTKCSRWIFPRCCRKPADALVGHEFADTRVLEAE